MIFECSFENMRIEYFYRDTTLMTSEINILGVLSGCSQTIKNKNFCQNIVRIKGDLNEDSAYTVYITDCTFENDIKIEDGFNVRFDNCHFKKCSIIDGKCDFLTFHDCTFDNMCVINSLARWSEFYDSVFNNRTANTEIIELLSNSDHFRLYDCKFNNCNYISDCLFGDFVFTKCEFNNSSFSITNESNNDDYEGTISCDNCIIEGNCYIIDQCNNSFKFEDVVRYLVYEPIGNNRILVNNGEVNNE